MWIYEYWTSQALHNSLEGLRMEKRIGSLVGCLFSFSRVTYASPRGWLNCLYLQGLIECSQEMITNFNPLIYKYMNFKKIIGNKL